MSEEIKETPTGELEQGEFKIKKKPRKLANKKPQETVKLDLAKKEEPKKEEVKQEIKEDAVPESSTTKVDVRELPKNGGEVGEAHAKKQEAAEEKKEEPVATITEITEQPKAEEEVKTPEPEPQPQLELPENIEKLVNFMKETGGDINDYVRLNADYSNIDDEALLKEYYKQTKPHLDQDEIEFIMEDKFYYDEDIDEDRDIRKKKLAKKEEIARAKNFLEETKSKYYDEIKLRPGVTQEQQKAMEFFNRYNNEQQTVQKQHEEFKNTTKNYFTKDFKGFEFNLGEKRFSYNVQNPETVADNQSNLTNFVKTFLDDKGNVKDYEGYHKAIYAARNADTIANHFYEQGKADAIKDVTAKSKNINEDVRSTTPGDLFINGLRVKAVNGVDSSRLKVKSKMKTKN
jgi:hypothetical protein